MKHKIIFILVSLWLVGAFAFETFEFVESLRTEHVYVPIGSFIGFFAWLAMLFRRKWSGFMFTLYILFGVFFGVQNIIHGEHRIYSVLALIVFLALGLPLRRYIYRHNGLCWNPEKPKEQSNLPISE